jgi:hypothetical protein
LQPIDPYSRYSFNDLLTCIREQRAALEKMLYDFDESDCEYEGDRAAVANARAVLAKWRIECEGGAPIAKESDK